MRRLFATLALAALAAPVALAQTAPMIPRFGISFQGMAAIPDGIGIGGRVRAATALNPDISLAVDLGATAFIIGGKEGADGAIEPQASAIINVGEGRFRDPVGAASNAYVIAGLGGYFPVGRTDSSSTSGLTLHGGVGFVQPLNTSSLFYEFNPAIVVRGKNDLGILIPVRVGLIF